MEAEAEDFKIPGIWYGVTLIELLAINSKLNPKVCSIATDKDSDGIADTRDMVTCSIKSFHALSNAGEIISMLAKYNLDVGRIYNDVGRPLD